MTATHGNAVVIGASMAGLTAARALSERFAQVTIVERDGGLDTPEPRKGVPQGRQAHGLLARGREILEELFPGFSEEAFAAGGVKADLAADVLWFNHGVYLANTPSDLLGLALSRPRFEGLVRDRVTRLANVTILSECDAVAPAFDASSQRVTGLTIRPRGGGMEVRHLPAELVVDASGRGSRTPQWLETIGFPRPREDSVKINLGYVTAQYRREPGQLPGKTAVVMAGCAPDWRCAALLGQEDNRWVVMLGGYLGAHPPTDPEGFLEFARGLQTPDIYEALRNAELLVAPTPHGFSANLRRRYEGLARFPEGYLVVGDALCSFNPAYGQGMTVACAEALLLRDALARGIDGVARRFFPAASRLIDTPWDIAVGSDLQHAEVEGARPLKVRFVNWYIGKFFRAASRDGALAEKFLRVANLLESPTALLAPSVALRMFRGRSGASTQALAGLAASEVTRH